MVEPQYPARDSVGKLSPLEPKLRQWPSTEHKKTKKLRRNLRSMYRDLVVLGFIGSYDRACASARQWKDSEQFKAQASGKGCFAPLRFACGEAFQFDWSEDFACIAGKQVKLQIAQSRLARSRVSVLRAYYQQKHEMLFDAHWYAFQIFGGIPKHGIYDNMKTAVDSVGHGKERGVNQRFTAMVSHYLFGVQLCNLTSGWEKDQIEKNVQDSCQRLWQGAPDSQGLADLNVQLEHRCKVLQSELHRPELDQTMRKASTDEQGELMVLPNTFDAFVEQTKRIILTCPVHHEGNRYNVPASYANRAISLRICVDKLVMAAEGQHTAEHPRLFGSGHAWRDHTQYDWHYYSSVLQKKPGALYNGASFAELSSAFKKLQFILLQRPGGDHDIVETLAPVLHHDEGAALSAVELALEYGKLSKGYVSNLLGRLTEEPPPKSIPIPKGLRPTLEPRANVNRHDSLRKAHDAA